MNARLMAMALAWSGVILAGCTERPTEPLTSTGPVFISLAPTPSPIAADAGLDVSTPINHPTWLEGWAEDTVDDRPIVEWHWQVLSGPGGGTLSNAGSQGTWFSAGLVGEYTVSFYACVDGPVCSNPDVVMVTVFNRPPIASATADKTTATVGETVCFDGSQSQDPDEQALSYSWNFGDGYGTDKVDPCHEFSSAGEFHVRLTVSDGSNQAYDDILITVEEQPGPEAAIQDLMDDVQALVTGGALSQDRADGLLMKLSAAVTSLNNDLSTDACKQLKAFVNQVKATVKAKKLTSAAGEALIASAEEIRTQIGCT